MASALTISGSLPRQSYNRSALRAAQELAPEGAKVEIFDLAGTPPFNQDEEKNPPVPVTELKERVRAADAILFSTPEYNYFDSRRAQECYRLDFASLWR